MRPSARINSRSTFSSSSSSIATTSGIASALDFRPPTPSAARSDLGECKGNRFANPLIVVIQLLRERWDRFVETKFSRQLRYVPHHKPLVVAEHVHELVGALFHTGQRHENAPPFLDGRSGREQIQEDFHAVLTGTSQHEQRIVAM